MKVENYESRATVGGVELRKKEDGSHALVGMAAVFDSRSENLGGFREIIAPGAFDNTDVSDVRGLFNHDENIVLGRSSAGTLKTERTENGLRYEIDLPDTLMVRDLVVEPIKRGDISQSSFGFTIARGGDQWDEDEEGVLIRTINDVKRLYDVSPVTFPAYADTQVGMRSLSRFEEQRNKEFIDGQAQARAKQLARITRRADLISRC